MDCTFSLHPVVEQIVDLLWLIHNKRRILLQNNCFKQFKCSNWVVVAGVPSNSFLHWTFCWNCNCATLDKVSCVYGWGGDWVKWLLHKQADLSPDPLHSHEWYLKQCMWPCLELSGAHKHGSSLALIGQYRAKTTRSSFIDKWPVWETEGEINRREREMSTSGHCTVTGVQTQTHTYLHIHTDSTPNNQLH